MAKFVALLDASALFSIRVTNLTLEAAKNELFQPRWSPDIAREWQEALIKKQPKSDPSKITLRQEAMDTAFPDAMVQTDYRSLMQGINLPDPNDAHVVAAAIASRCDAIVTFNIKDFPPDTLATFGLEALHPDDFLLHQLSLCQPLFLSAAKEVFQRLRNPKMTVSEYLDSLRKANLSLLADALAEHARTLA